MGLSAMLGSEIVKFCWLSIRACMSWKSGSSKRQFGSFASSSSSDWIACAESVPCITGYKRKAHHSWEHTTWRPHHWQSLWNKQKSSSRLGVLQEKEQKAFNSQVVFSLFFSILLLSGSSQRQYGPSPHLRNLIGWLAHNTYPA